MGALARAHRAGAWLYHLVPAPGLRWRHPASIGHAHANSSRTILLLSDAYAKSGYCSSEWEMRYQQDPGGERDLLILFRVNACAPHPLLGRIAHVDLFNCASDEEAWEEVRHRLLKAVQPSYRRPLGEAAWPGAKTAHAPFPVPEHNLPFPNLSFVGRTDELDELARALASTGRSAITQLPQAITGLGGIGKSQLALAYAYARLADYDLIRWIRAEEPTALATDYAGLASALRLDPETRDQAVLVAAIRTALERCDRWLLRAIQFWLACTTQCVPR
jgi:hypothetical protein